MENTQNAVSLEQLIGYVETKNNYSSLRFEPTTYTKLSLNRTDSDKLLIAKIQQVNDCSWHTALMIYSTSFGQCQLMGFNLYANYDGKIVDYLTDKIQQTKSFAYFVGTNRLLDFDPQSLANSKLSRIQFAHIYNGAESYADLIADALKHFNFTVKD